MIYQRRVISILGLLVIFFLAACSTSSTAVLPDENPSTTESITQSQATPDLQETSTAPSSDLEADSQAQTDSNSEETPPIEQNPSEIVGENTLLLFPDMLLMENLMPTQGVGERPRFEWQSIDGASYYGIVIYTPDDTPYWAWRGREPWVYLGGIEEALPDINEGPILIEGMTWRIVAYNEQDVPIATGGPWAIAP
jgi:hypothetical protein